MEITTTTMGMVGTIGVPNRDFRHAALRSMTKREVKYAASSFVNKALTWWNTQIQARGSEAAIGMTWNDFKDLLVEEFCPSIEMERLENKFWNHKMVGANHVAYTDRFHELAKLVPHLVKPESAHIKRYVTGLAPEIRGMLKATQPTTIRDAILRVDILTDEAISCGTLSKSNEKRKAVEETEDEFSRLCFNCQRPGHFAKDCQSPFKRATLVNAVRIEFEPGTAPRVFRRRVSSKARLIPAMPSSLLVIIAIEIALKRGRLPSWPLYMGGGDSGGEGKTLTKVLFELQGKKRENNP
ncbi:reverse transcriptase domain-containing protein [Tanacetum coccineum]